MYLNLLLKAKKKISELLDLYDYIDGNWDRLKRTSQTEPSSNWNIWLILAGRGFGKTRTGAETVKNWALNGKFKRIALIGNTLTEAKSVMINGESGLLTIHNKWNMPKLKDNTLYWENGAKAFLMSGFLPEKFRGPEFDAAWVDELAKFKKADELFDQLMMCLRIGSNPKCIITTTPKPAPVLKRIMNMENSVVTFGTTFENKDNLSKSFIKNLESTLSTSMLAQEIYGKLLDEQEGALWKRNMILYKKAPINLVKIVVSIDPAITKNCCETGIIVSGIDESEEMYILSDLSGKYSVSDWTKIAVNAYHKFKADRIIAEVNNGGDLVEKVIRLMDQNVSYKAVHASRGKITRAEPVASLYERGKVFHNEHFEELENQMCTYTKDSSFSPDRLDALVWGVHYLVFEKNSIKIWNC